MIEEILLNFCFFYGMKNQSKTIECNHWTNWFHLVQILVQIFSLLWFHKLVIAI